MLQFTDIGAENKLKKEQEKNKMLQMLNATVHHEMLSPLKSNVILANRLLQDPMFLDDTLVNLKAKNYIQTIFTSSNLLLHHSNDLLDYRIIENGGFQPQLSESSLSDSILEIV